MPYAGDIGVVSQSPDKLRKMMGVVVVVCAAFGLTVPEAKTEIMCLRAKGMPESTATFSVDAAGQVYSQTNEFAYLGGNVNHSVDLSIEDDRRIRNAWRAASENTPSNCKTNQALPSSSNPDAQSRGSRDNVVRLRHVEPSRVPLQYAAPSPPQLSDSLHWLAKEQSHQPPDFLSGHAYQLRRRRILFAAFVARMEDTRLPKCVVFGELVGSAG